MPNRLIVMALVVVGIGILLYFVQSNSGGSSSNIPLEEKMSKAEEVLSERHSKASQVLSDMETVTSDHDKIVKKMKKTKLNFSLK